MSGGRNLILAKAVIIGWAAFACSATLSAEESPRRVDPYYAKREAALQPPPVVEEAAEGEGDLAPDVQYGPDAQYGDVVPAAAYQQQVIADQGIPYGGMGNMVPGQMYAADGSILPPGYLQQVPTGEDGSVVVDSPGGEYGDCEYPSYESGDGFPAEMPCGPLWSELQNPTRVWAGFDYLNWDVKGMWIPPLVTTSLPGTPQSDAGVLGEPNTRILYGDQKILNDDRQGGRFRLGWWIGSCQSWGIEGDYYRLEKEYEDFAAASDFSNPNSNDPILARPFSNVNLGVEDSLVLAFPGFIFGGVPINLSGTVAVQSDSELHSGGLALRKLLWMDLARDWRLFMTGGYRFFALDENLSIASTIRPTGGGVFPAGTVFSAFDQFSTRSEFHGGEVGWLWQINRGRLGLDTQFRFAMGNMHENVSINGRSVAFNGVAPIPSVGGLLAQSTNIGDYERNQFAMIPALSIKLNLAVIRNLRLNIGYDVTYVTRLVRPGSQIDMLFNPTQKPGPLVGAARPTALLTPTDLLLNGASAGFELRF